MKSFYIIDGHYQIYRAFYGLQQPLSSPTGEPTGATHLFCAMLFGLIRDRKPDYLAMVMDVSDETVFRREIASDYKAHRDPAPEALGIQADRIVTIVQALGVPIYRKPGFEADDLMATIVERLRDEDVMIYLVSRDKDLDQLLSDRVRLLDPTTGEITDPHRLLEKKGYLPDKAVEIQTLVGDSTDNVRGVNGVGPKTAVKLIAQYGSAAETIAHADEQTPKLKERLLEFAPRLDDTRQLVTLRRDVPFDFDLAECSSNRFHSDSVRPIFEELRFHRLMETLQSLDISPAPSVEGQPLQTSLPSSQEGITGGLQGDSNPNPERKRAGSTSLPLGQGATQGGFDFEAARSAEPRKPNAGYKLVDTPEKLASFLHLLDQQKEFAFDTETTGLNPVGSDLVGLSISWNEGEGYYLPIRSMMGNTLPLDHVVSGLRSVFENPTVAKIGQNCKFDMLVLRKIGIDTVGLRFDTMIASFLLDPMRRSHSLDFLAKSFFDHDMIPITDLIGKGKNQITMDQVDTRQVCEYAAEDADFTWRLKEVLNPQITGAHVEDLFRETEMPLVEVLAEMEFNGVAIDSAFLKSLNVEMSGRLMELTRQIHQAAGHPFNLDSPKQLANVLFDEQGFSVVRKTKTGRSTDADSLEAIAAETDHPIPKLLLEYRELSKLKGTYVDTLPSQVNPRTGRIHASFNQTGAITGRLSSNDPNLQNIPIRTEAGRRIRQAFIAVDSDHVLLAADYSQIELRLLAHFSQDANLLEAFRQGQDIHRTVAAQVNGITQDQVTSTQRSAAKAVNFGIIYGQTAFGLSRSLGISSSEARAFIDAYFARYPGIRTFIDHCIKEARERGFAQTILGRRRPITELISRNRGQVQFGERIAVNTVVQGSAADLIKRAMVDIHRRLKSEPNPARMLMQVHDELVFEVARTNLESQTQIIRDGMQNCIKLEVPLVVDISTGRTWAECK